MSEARYFIIRLLSKNIEDPSRYLHVSKSGYGYGDTLDITAATRFGSREQAEYWMNAAKKNRFYKEKGYIFEILEAENA